MRNTTAILIIVLFFTFSLASKIQARLNSFTSGITTGYKYTETQYDEKENRINSKFSVGPLFTLQSSSSLDQIIIKYNPTYVFDTEDNTSYFEHDVFLGCYREFTRRLRFDLSDSFIASDDPNLIETENISDYNNSHKRYWTNKFNVKGRYLYDRESLFGGGYSYDILRNRDTGFNGYEDYDKHVADVFLKHRINASWKIAAMASYTRGLFAPPDQEIADGVTTGLDALSEGITNDVDSDNLSNDLSEYHASASLYWLASSTKTLHATYSYSASNYDSFVKHDTTLHNLTFGAEYTYSPFLAFALGGGPSYKKRASSDGNWGYNAFFNFAYQLAKRSVIAGTISKGYNQENFSYNNTYYGRNQGLAEFWQYRLDFTQQLWKDLILTLFVSYHDQKQENVLDIVVNSVEDDVDQQPIDRETFRDDSVFNTDAYVAGGSLSYAFMEYWKTALSYSYRKQDSEIVDDSYEEHQVYLTLSVQKEIIRW